MEDPCLQWSKSLSHTPSSWEISISTGTASSEWEEQREHKIQGGCFSPKVLQGKLWLIKVLLKCKELSWEWKCGSEGRSWAWRAEPDPGGWNAEPQRITSWTYTWMSFLGCAGELFRNADFLLSFPFIFIQPLYPRLLPPQLAFRCLFHTLFLNPQKKNRTWRGRWGLHPEPPWHWVQMC